MVDPCMNDAQRLKNREARQHLVVGKFYKFESPVESTGTPVNSGVWRCEVLQFSRGEYGGFDEDDEVHVFKGFPLDDIRSIPDQEDRECFFTVLFIGGALATEDEDQGKEQPPTPPRLRLLE